jgi:hypothetical protein
MINRTYVRAAIAFATDRVPKFGHQIPAGQFDEHASPVIDDSLYDRQGLSGTYRENESSQASSPDGNILKIANAHQLTFLAPSDDTDRPASIPFPVPEHLLCH